MLAHIFGPMACFVSMIVMFGLVDPYATAMISFHRTAAHDVTATHLGSHVPSGIYVSSLHINLHLNQSEA